jgi:hypothetical protein
MTDKTLLPETVLLRIEDKVHSMNVNEKYCLNEAALQYTLIKTVKDAFNLVQIYAPEVLKNDFKLPEEQRLIVFNMS